MATIAAGNHVEVYVPLAGDITITPGTGGYVDFGCSSPSGEEAPEGRRLYAAAAIAIPAGSTMFLRAEGEDATYTDPVTAGGVITSYTAAQLSALAAAGGVTPYAEYVVGNTGVPLWAGSANSIGSLSSVIVRANLSTGNAAAQNSAAIVAAVAALALATNGGAGTVQFPEGEYNCDGAITITGFYPQEAGGWNGGILFKGAGIEATRLNFASTKAFIIDATGGTAGSTSFVDFADMKITGPGKAVSGSSLIEYAPQASVAYASSPAAVRVRHENLYLTGAESLVILNNCTNYLAQRCLLQSYVYAMAFGYNVDIVTVVQCAFGSSLTTLGTQSETAFYYGYTGNLTGLSSRSNNAHQFVGCWFMRQALVANVLDTSCSTIKFDNCYIEASFQYAQLGASGSSSGIRGIGWENCHFSQPYRAGETAAKIQAMNAASNGYVWLTNCRSDSTDGPNGGWIDAGGTAGLTVYMKGNDLPTGGSASTVAHIVYGTKLIVVPQFGEYNFGSATGAGQLQEQFNGNTSNPHREVIAFGSTASTIFAKYGVKATANETYVANYATIVDVLDGGTHYVFWFGGLKELLVTALPTAASGFRGCRLVLDGGGGVADREYVCLKNAAGAYNWNLVTTGA